METFLIKALQLVLSISLLVILHEGGHFFFAKLFGIRVHRFCLFFDFWKGDKRMALPLGTWGGTQFAIGWLPFGGYVDIAGMVDESTDAGRPTLQKQAGLAAFARHGGRCAGQFLGGALYLCHDPLDVGRTAHAGDGRAARLFLQLHGECIVFPRR